MMRVYQRHSYTRLVELKIFGLVKYLAYAMIILCAVTLIYDYKTVKMLLTGRVFIENIESEEISPREVLATIYTTAKECIVQDRLDSLSIPNVRESGEPVEGAYEFDYHVKIDKEKMCRKLFEKNDAPRPIRPSISKSFSRCISNRLLEGGVLDEPKQLDSRILWAYLFIERSSVGEILIWPDAEVPQGYNPWNRPWAPDNVTQHGRCMSQIDDNNICQTAPYLDAFSGEHIISLTIPHQIGDMKIGAAVDVRVGSTPSIYARMLFLNYFISCAFFVVTWFGRNLPAYYFKAWHRTWLSFAVLYSFLAYRYFGDPPLNILWGIGSRSSVPLSFLSIVNSYYLLVTALALFQPTNARRARRVSTQAGIGVAVLFIITEYLEYLVEDLIFPLSAGELVEVLFSGVALALFGFALSSVLLSWRGTGNVIISRRSATGAYVIITFSVFYALLQLTIPLWQFWPTLEDIFWILSIPMKIGMFALFTIVVLLDLYWKRVATNNLFIDNLRKGIVATDADFKVINVNNIAAEIIGLPAVTLRKKDMKQVLFRSLTEAEEIYRAIRAGKVIEDRVIRTKEFAGETSVFREVERIVSVYPAGRGISERAYALFVISE